MVELLKFSQSSRWILKYGFIFLQIKHNFIVESMKHKMSYKLTFIWHCGICSVLKGDVLVQFSSVLMNCLWFALVKSQNTTALSLYLFFLPFLYVTIHSSWCDGVFWFDVQLSALMEMLICKQSTGTLSNPWSTISLNEGTYSTYLESSHTETEFSLSHNKPKLDW